MGLLFSGQDQRDEDSPAGLASEADRSGRMRIPIIAYQSVQNGVESSNERWK